VNLTNGYNGHLTSREAGSVGGYDYIAYALTLSLSSTYCESAHVIKIAAVSTAAIFTND
jgi:hypothetical protein